MPKTTPHSVSSRHLCHHWHEYRLTCEAYDALVARAAGKCEICQEPHPRLGIDHDHAIAWGAVRGLLCPGCNSRLGFVDRGRREATEHEQRYIDNAYWKSLYADPRVSMN